MRLERIYQESYLEAWFYRGPSKRIVDPDHVRRNLEIKVTHIQNTGIFGWFFKKIFLLDGEQLYDIDAFVDGEHVGYANIGFLPSLNRHCVYQIEVFPPFNRMGVGARIAQVAKDRFGTYVKSETVSTQGAGFRNKIGDGSPPPDIDTKAERKIHSRYRLGR